MLMETGRPVENEALNFEENGKWVLPGPLGAHNWQAMSVDVKAGLVYLPAQDNPLFYEMSEEYKNTGIFKRKPQGGTPGSSSVVWLK